MAVPYIIHRDSKVYLYIGGNISYSIELLASDFSFTRTPNKVSYGGGTLHSPKLVKSRLSNSLSEIDITLKLNLTAEVDCVRALAAMFNCEFTDGITYAEMELREDPSLLGSVPVDLYIDSTDTNYIKLGNIVGQSLSLSGSTGNVLVAEIKLKASTLESNVVQPLVSQSVSQDYSKIITTLGQLTLERDSATELKLNTASFGYSRAVKYLNDNSVHYAMSQLPYSPSRPTLGSVTIGGTYRQYATELTYTEDYGELLVKFCNNLEVELPSCHFITKTVMGDLYMLDVDYHAMPNSTKVLRIIT